MSFILNNIITYFLSVNFTSLDIIIWWPTGTGECVFLNVSHLAREKKKKGEGQREKREKHKRESGFISKILAGLSASSISPKSGLPIQDPVSGQRTGVFGNHQLLDQSTEAKLN